MRKLLWLGLGTVVLGTVVLGGVGGVWFFWARLSATNSNLVAANDPDRASQNTKGEADDEASDVIEPLVVDSGSQKEDGSGAPEGDFAVELESVLRAILEPGMKQPPRPDAEPGAPSRMPYADEEDVLGVTKDPVTRILESDKPKVTVFDEIDKTKPPEESEPKAPEPPAVDPHQGHCPRYDGCPAPYPYRMTPHN
jgi:hypothetical protein